MHSSRMRTARFLAVSPTMHCAGRGCLLLGGCLLLEGVVYFGRVSSGGGLLSQHALRQTPPVKRMTDRQV